VLGAENLVKNINQIVGLRVLKMGDVLVILKVMPEGLESDIEEISKDLENIGIGKFNSLEKEPIAFGLMALKPSYVVEDTGGVSDLLEEKIKEIRGVKTAEVISASLV
jgi:translation elongation factor aEF-1 beta